jgi:hypothetical protein
MVTGQYTTGAGKFMYNCGLDAAATLLPGIADVAQLVEQRIRNAKVGGSTPLIGTTVFKTPALPWAGVFAGCVRKV